MLTTLTASLVLAAATYSDYPAYVRSRPQIEAVIDRGPILELIVRCSEGTAVVSYSKVERLFCSPKMHCGAGRQAILRRSCRL